MSSGFFAFRNPAPDRIMSNWFLASARDCYLTSVLCESISGYWMNNTFKGMKKSRPMKVKKFLQKHLSGDTRYTHLWFAWPVVKVLQVHPLFWFHYLFARLVRKDQRFRSIWEATPYRAADPMHAMQKFGQSKMITPEFAERLRRREEVMYKLSWKKAAKEGMPEGSALHYLIELNSADASH
jgi:hypothetical protein